MYFIYEIQTAFPSEQRWLNENIYCRIQIEINLINNNKFQVV